MGELCRIIRHLGSGIMLAGAGSGLQMRIVTTESVSSFVLMFDSEHFLGRHLKRYNNWEIHPVLKFEYCPTGQTCSKDSGNWKNLDYL
jgi:hypothetical protein